MANPKAAKPSKSKPGTRAARPRIDALIRHIKAGSYDMEMAEIRQAIEERNKTRQEIVLATVREVFGAGAEVVQSGTAVQAVQAVQAVRPAVPRRTRPG